MRKEIKKYVLICAILMGALFFVTAMEIPSEIIPDNEKPVWSVSLRTAEEFKDKYNLQFAGLGQSVDNQLLKTIKLSFLKEEILSKDHARKLVLNCAKELLDNINSFEEIQPYLAEHPFSEKNIGIVIFFYNDSSHRTTIHPDICCVSLWDNVIRYSTNEPLPPHPYKTTEKETIEEARQIVKEG